MWRIAQDIILVNVLLPNSKFCKGLSKHMQLNAFISRHHQFPSSPSSTLSCPHLPITTTTTISISTLLLPTSAQTSNPWSVCYATGSFPLVPPHPNPPLQRCPNPPLQKASSTPPASSPYQTRTCPGTQHPVARAFTLVLTRRTGVVITNNQRRSTTLEL